MSTEIIEEIKEDSPVPPDQAEQLLKIVEDHDKQEVADKYMMTSSRLLLRKQLRQETIVDKNTIPDLFKYPRPSSLNYNSTGDTNEHRNSYTSSSSSAYERYSDCHI